MHNDYSPRKADEPFLTGTSREMRERYRLIAQTLEITVPQAKQQDEHTFPGLGESSLRVIDALLRVGADMTVDELAEETGKKVSSIRTALHRLEQHNIVEAERQGSRGPKLYGLCPDVWQKIEAIAPTLRTYKLSSQRENKRLENAQQWCDQNLVAAQAANDADTVQMLQHRFSGLAQKRIPHLTRLHPDLSPQEIERLAYQVVAFKRTPEQREQLRKERNQNTDLRSKAAEIREIRDAAMQAAKGFFDQELERPTQRMIAKRIISRKGFGNLSEQERAAKIQLVKRVLRSPKLMEPYWQMARDPSRPWNYGAKYSPRYKTGLVME